MALDFALRCRSAHPEAKGARQARRERLAAAQPVDEAVLVALEEPAVVPEGLEEVTAMVSPILCLPSSIWTVTASSLPRNSKPSLR